MHSNTMDIMEFDNQEAAVKAGYTIPLKKEEADLLQPLNREQRRAWLKMQRKSGYIPSPKKGKK